jgi:hypothetical protein
VNDEPQAEEIQNVGRQSFTDQRRRQLRLIEAAVLSRDPAARDKATGHRYIGEVRREALLEEIRDLLLEIRDGLRR